MNQIITILVSATLVFSIFSNLEVPRGSEVKTEMIEVKEKLEDSDLSTLHEVYIVEDYLGYFFGDIDKKKLEQIERKLRLATQIYKKDEYASEQYLRLKSQAYQMIRSSGYDVPLHSLIDAAEVLKNDISKYEYELLVSLATRSTKEKNESHILVDVFIADIILKKFGLSANELLIQSASDGMQLALYNVKDGKIKRNNLDTVIDKNQKLVVEKEHQKMWDRIKEIIPSEYLSLIDRFEVSTDGIGKITAYVEGTDNNKWSISVDPNDILDENGDFTTQSIYTIIHESAHIISLNKGQMDSEKSDNSTYVVREGKLKKYAYLNVFYQIFWGHIVDSDIEESDEYKHMREFYKKHKDEFVTEYASTNPSEDLAESFAYFIIKPKPTGSLLKDKKILFFYEYPEFVHIRERMREVINNKK